MFERFKHQPSDANGDTAARRRRPPWPIAGPATAPRHAQSRDRRRTRTRRHPRAPGRRARAPARGVRRHQLGRRVLRLARGRRPRLAAGRHPRRRRRRRRADRGVRTRRRRSNAETLGLGGAIALLVVLMIAYYCGGYVAGRMSRFDGTRQGVGAWLFGIAVTVLLALAAVILGSEYNVLEQLNLPSLPVGRLHVDHRRRDRARRRRARARCWRPSWAARRASATTARSTASGSSTERPN